MPTRTRLHRQHVTSKLAAFDEVHRQILSKLAVLDVKVTELSRQVKRDTPAAAALGEVSTQITQLAKASTVQTVLDQLAALGLLVGEGQDGLCAQMNGILAAVKNAAGPAAPEPPAPGPEQPPAAPAARRRRPANGR